MANLLVLVAIGYALILAFMYLLQSRLVYFPEVGRAIGLTPKAAGLEFESVALKTDDGETLHGWWVPVKDARGTVLIFHGNAGNISHRIEYLAMFRRLGYASFIIDYRGYGQSTGTPSEQGTYRDAEAAWRHLTQTHQLAPHDIVVFGESLGGGVATWLVVQHAPRAVILASTFTSVPDLGAQVYWFIPVRLLARIQYDNRANLANMQVPVLIAHSRDDDIIPFSHGQALFAAAREPKQFLELRGGHNDGFLFTGEEWIVAIGRFLEGVARR